MDQIKFPDIMTSGFNFDEAITMAELCRRVYKVFENQYTTKPKELYDATYSDDEWEFIHSISDYKTDGRALILKRKNKNQFAVVFRGTVFTSGGFEFTGQQGNEDIRMAEYEPIPDERTPPSKNVRVYAGMMNGFKALKNKLEFFLDIMFYGIKKEHLIKLMQFNKEDRKEIIYVMHYSNLFRLNIINKKLISVINNNKNNDLEDIVIEKIFRLDEFSNLFIDLENVNINDKDKINSLSEEMIRI